MEAIIQVLSAPDPATELRTLRASLLFEEALRGRVEFRTSPQPPGGESLAIELGADGVGAALAQGLDTWLQQRGTGVRLRLTIDIEPGQSPTGAVPELAALLGAVRGEVAPAPGGRGITPDELVRRIETSVFSKPPVGKRGYDEDAVDAFLEAVIASIRSGHPLKPDDVHNVVFKKPPFGKRGYDPADVDMLIDDIELALRNLAL